MVGPSRSTWHWRHAIVAPTPMGRQGGNCRLTMKRKAALETATARLNPVLLPPSPSLPRASAEPSGSCDRGAAIDERRRSRDEGRGIGGEIEHRAGDLLRPGDA